ncbi:hypothetical protein [uncultured Thiocystis sp.]|uniref:hypothetical protein n=1 Tax=uncultured Thiocystis sp. TaxID=1202134 RepID=UPI0025D53940|nr:hypothetical protein [uncultured Thiocystis sp.]
MKTPLETMLIVVNSHRKTPGISVMRLECLKLSRRPRAMLHIKLESICYIIAKIREFQAKEEVVLPDTPASPSEDWALQVLADHSEDSWVFGVFFSNFQWYKYFRNRTLKTLAII